MNDEIDDILQFNPKLPDRKSFEGTLQVGLDSTSLQAFQTCAHKYYLQIICGVVPLGISPHLRFGIAYHSALELYHRNRATGMSHEDCLLASVKFCMETTWERRLNRPWVSDHKTKNRFILVKTVIDYFDRYTPESDAFETVILPNGSPAVELTFAYPINYKSSGGQQYELCGHIDRLAMSERKFYEVDYKTTERPLEGKYWDEYQVSVQLKLYYFVGQIIFPEPVKDIIIDAARVSADGPTEFERKAISVSRATLNEWNMELAYWLSYMEMCSKQAYWPHNWKACVQGWSTCEFYEVCRQCPSVRKDWLKNGFGRRFWDPKQNRGED